MCIVGLTSCKYVSGKAKERVNVMFAILLLELAGDAVSAML
jgi:hypothetical protein